MRRPVVPSARTAVVSLAVLGVALAATPATAVDPGPGARLPAVRVETVVSGLSYPWDLDWLPGGAMIYTQREGTTRLRAPGATGQGRLLRMNQRDLFVAGEKGLLGIAVDPAFGSNRRFYTCQAFAGSGSQAPDVRVLRWQLAADGSGATRVGSPVVSGMPLGDIHAGCRLRFAPDGTLFVGTGDGATGTAPQSLNSLGGKVLRVNTDGTAPADNPFRARGGAAAYVWTKGHRNVQGLALRPGTNQLWSAEHGPDRDDEINLIRKGANYGWNPVPGYNQDVPMTDTVEFPRARTAQWSSGVPTRATSGATFLTGSAWGADEGKLAVGLLKDSTVMLLTVGADNRVTDQRDLPRLTSTYGRIRTVQMGPDDAMYVTTSNGNGRDVILRVTPVG